MNLMNRITWLFIAILLSVAAIPTASAQLRSISSPSCMSKSECDKVKTPGSVCNSGAEPFSTFLKKFKTSEKFRNSRVATGKNHDMVRGMLKMLGRDWNYKYTFPVFQHKDKCRKGYATWYAVTANHVCYRLDEYDACIGGGSTMAIEFVRYKGKWYAVDMILAG